MVSWGPLTDRRVGPAGSALGVSVRSGDPMNFTRVVGQSQAQNTRCSGAIWVGAARCGGFRVHGHSTLTGRLSTLRTGSSTGGGAVVHGRGAGCTRGFHGHH